MICDEFYDEFWLFLVHLRCQNSLKRHNIQNFAELTKMTKRDLLNLDGIGKKAVQEIVEALAEKGLLLSTGPEDNYHWLEKGKQINRQLKGLASMKEDTTTIDPTWMEKTGGFARDMTLRDEFAARAMQGYLTGDYDFYPHVAAKKAYAIADDMLAARDAK